MALKVESGGSRPNRVTTCSFSLISSQKQRPPNSFHTPSATSGTIVGRVLGANWNATLNCPSNFYGCTRYVASWLWYSLLLIKALRLLSCSERDWLVHSGLFAAPRTTAGIQGHDELNQDLDRASSQAT